MEKHKSVLEDHERLRVLLRDLRMVSRWKADLIREMQVRIKLSFDLQALKLLLQRHFETEESGSYMDEVRSRKASAGDSLRALQDEHPVLLRQISALTSSCIQADMDANACAEFLQELTSILYSLSQHEAKETSLIKEVFQSI